MTRLLTVLGWVLSTIAIIGTILLIAYAIHYAIAYPCPKG